MRQNSINADLPTLDSAEITVLARMADNVITESMGDHGVIKSIDFSQSYLTRKQITHNIGRLKNMGLVTVLGNARKGEFILHAPVDKLLRNSGYEYARVLVMHDKNMQDKEE